MKLRRFALLFMLGLLICCPGSIWAWTPSAGWDTAPSTDLVTDTSPELGGNLDAKSYLIYDSTDALELGTAAASGHSLGTGDVIIGGKLEVDGTTHFDQEIIIYDYIRFNDDKLLGLGTSNDFGIRYETADTNARGVRFEAPEGGAENVPVWVFGDVTIFDANLGFFDGYTEPNIAVVDDDGDSWGTLGFAEDDHFSLNFNGDMKLGYDPNAANDNIGVLQFTESDGTNIPILVVSDVSFAPNGDATFDDITEPTIAIMSDDLSRRVVIDSSRIDFVGASTNYYKGIRQRFDYRQDVSSANPFSFDQFNATSELTAANSRQAMIYVGGEFAQSGTAAADMLFLNATTTSLGDGTTGDGNNFISARDDTVIKFKLGLDGVMQLYADPVFLGYSRHIDIQAGTAFLGPTAPTANSVGYARVLGFDADGETAHFNWEVPDDWDGASNFTVEVIWTGTEGDAVADTEKVKMDINYYCIAEGEALDNGTPVEATTTYTASGNQTDKEMFETDITIVYTGGNQDLTKGETVTMEFNRDVTGEAGDAYSGACQVLRWEIKYTATGMPYQ